MASTGIIVSAVIERVHMSAPMIPNVLLYDLNLDARSMFSAACAKKGNGFKQRRRCCMELVWQGRY
jgi:hypothetical protein